MRRALAAAALVLGVGAAVAGGRGMPALKQVSAPELAREIRDRRLGLAVIDLRPAVAFEAEAVPIARNGLPAGPITGTAVLYGGDEAVTARAAAALRAQGASDVRVLGGGLEAWRSEVLSPMLPADPSAWTAPQAEVAALAAYFGGRPRSSDDAPSPRGGRRRGC